MSLNTTEQTPTVFQRFDTLRFPMILLIIFIHNVSQEVQYNGGEVVQQGSSPLLNFTTIFISEGIARVAVPLFYVMSAYLFFLSSQLTGELYKRKLSHRLRTLLVPYVFWNVALFLVLYIAQRTPAASFINRGPLTFDLGAILGLTDYPIAYQFWFIRDLMVLCLLSPIFYVAARHLGVWLLVPIAALWASRLWPISIPGIEPVMFFYLGTVLAVRANTPFGMDRFWAPLSALAVAVFAVRPFLTDAPEAFRLTQCFGIICLLIGVLGLSRPLSVTRFGAWLGGMSAASFFVFAIHEPLLTILRKVAFRLLPTQEWVGAALYLSLPFLVAAIALVAFRAMEKVLPRVIGFITGRPVGK